MSGKYLPPCRVMHDRRPVAVVGFDDIILGGLSTRRWFHQPARLLGEQSCTRLLDSVAQPDLARRCNYCQQN